MAFREKWNQWERDCKKQGEGEYCYDVWDLSDLMKTDTQSWLPDKIKIELSACEYNLSVFFLNHESNGSVGKGRGIVYWTTMKLGDDLEQIFEKAWVDYFK
jgi:hypothetical protein